ncbi:MAG TPA: EAL domain-containing protein [Nocardioides sp.]|nr:EAL domain-containing protein [Nocardioides sp.]
MSTVVSGLREKRGWWLDLLVFTTGIAVFVATGVLSLTTGPDLPPTMLVLVPVIALVARFPLVIDRADGGIEVGFDSNVLMFMLCTLDAHDALLLWSAGVVLTQVTSGKKLSSALFNIGIGICAGALSSGVLHAVRQGDIGTPRELAAVALAAGVYFASDYLASAVSVAISSRSPVRMHLIQRSTLLALACVVPFDTLGYLDAVVLRLAPRWTVALLAIPFVTLLVATHAVTRGQENARRLTVLFDAAVKAQTLASRGEIQTAVVEDAQHLLHVREVEVRQTAPGPGEIGVRLDCGDDACWVVAPARSRARSTVAADAEALQALGAVASDAYGRLKLTEDMVHFARHDPLTDLPNRGILEDRLKQALVRTHRHGTEVALLFIDLDGFKPVNDRFGHAAGDAVLVELAHRLRACVRESDTVARLGGDEFAVLFEDVDAQAIEAASQRVLDAVAEGADVAGQRLPLSASAGIAFGSSSDDAQRLLVKADMAMYEAKARGKARVVRYEEVIGRSRIERLVLVDDLRRALEDQQISVVYQPVLSVDTGAIVGVEALARWSRDGEPVPPDVFIPVAEETGQIGALGEVVLAQAAADAARLELIVGPGFGMGVNVSAQQLRLPSFVEAVRRAAEATNANLVLEITEREGLDADPVVLETMERIAALGVRFAIDDFGVGFSSISCLQDLPVQIVKADATLASGIDTDPRARDLLRSVALMGQTLGLDVVVEGIEREDQLAVVQEDEPGVCVQGYLLYRPMAIEDLQDVLRKERAA